METDLQVKQILKHYLGNRCSHDELLAVLIKACPSLPREHVSCIIGRQSGQAVVDIDVFIDDLFGIKEDTRHGSLMSRMSSLEARLIKLENAMASNVQHTRPVADEVADHSSFSSKVQELEAQIAALTQATFQSELEARAGEAPKAAKQASAASAVAFLSTATRRTEIDIPAMEAEGLITYEKAISELGGQDAVNEQQDFSNMLMGQVGNSELSRRLKAFFPLECKSSGAAVVCQDYVADLDSLYELAAVAMPSFNERVESLAKSTGGTPVLCRAPKGKERAILKAQHKYQDSFGKTAWYRLTDIDRATLVYPTIESMYKGARAILESFQADVLEFNDRYQKPMHGGYMDLQFLVRHMGVVCELQLNTQLMVEAKEKSGHRIYDVVRELKQVVEAGNLERTRQTLDWALEHLGSHSDLVDVMNDVIHVAAKAGHADILFDFLVRGADPNCKKNGETPLHLAVAGGHERAVWALVSAGGADVTVENDAGNSPLLEGYLKLHTCPDNDECARALTLVAYQAGLEHLDRSMAKVGEEVKKRKRTSTELVQLSADGLLDKMAVELRAFADPDSCNPSGMPAVCAAAFHGQTAAVKLLLEAKASPLKQDVSTQKSAMEVAFAESANINMSGMVNESLVEMTQLLLCAMPSDLAEVQWNLQLVGTASATSNRCTFVHAPALAQGKEVELTLSSHIGLAVELPVNLKEQENHPCLQLGGGEALRVSFDRSRIFTADGRFLMIDDWIWGTGSPITLYPLGDAERTSENGKFDFIVNDDGTISPLHAPQYALGVNIAAKAFSSISMCTRHPVKDIRDLAKRILRQAPGNKCSVLDQANAAIAKRVKQHPFVGKIDTGLSWTIASRLAQERGGRLPTLEEMVTADICDGAIDQWQPINDIGCNFWLQTGTVGQRLYATEKPFWGTTNVAEEWRPTTQGTDANHSVHHFYVYVDESS